MKSKPHRKESRSDWDRVRVKIMRWCLRVKLAQNWESFAALLQETGDRPIVEQSKNDSFWGAKPIDDETLVGMNVLGRLLMELREAARDESNESLQNVQPVDIPEFLLRGEQIKTVGPARLTIEGYSPTIVVKEEEQIQGLLFDDRDSERAPRIDDAIANVERPSQPAVKPYSAMKDSGVEWLGEVPGHWEVRRLKYILREQDKRSSDGSEQLLRVSQYTGVTERKGKDGTNEPDTRAASLVGYKSVEPDELVVNIMLAWNGSMGVSAFQGICSPAYCVYRFNDHAVPLYFHSLLRSPSYKAQIKAVSTGVIESRLRLYTDDLYRLEGLVPPLLEQAAIVRYLDHVDRRVQRLMRAKRKLIALLKEQKQAIIHRAVTRGLDPDVPLKDSGVEWLGKVPKHWDVVMNQRIFKENIRPHHGQEETPLSLSQRDGLIATTDMKERSLKTSTYDNWKVTRPGDIVVNRFKAHLGVFFASTLRGIVSFHYGVFEPRRKLVPKYFEHLYHTQPYRTIYAGRSNGMAVGLQNLSNQNFYNVKSIVPPLAEQVAIVEHLKQATADVDYAITRTRSEVELLDEYRVRLIADVVTGKLDVRAAAATLPEVDPLGTEGDFDDTLDANTEAELDELDAIPEEAEA